HASNGKAQRVLSVPFVTRSVIWNEQDSGRSGAVGLEVLVRCDAQRRMSVVEITPIQTPPASITGMPLIWCNSNRRAASRNGICSGTEIPSRLIRSWAVRVIVGRMVVCMIHLLKGEWEVV